MQFSSFVLFIYLCISRFPSDTISVYLKDMIYFIFFLQCRTACNKLFSRSEMSYFILISQIYFLRLQNFRLAGVCVHVHARTRACVYGCVFLQYYKNVVPFFLIALFLASSRALILVCSSLCIACLYGGCHKVFSLYWF